MLLTGHRKKKTKHLGQTKKPRVEEPAPEPECDEEDLPVDDGQGGFTSSEENGAEDEAPRQPPAKSTSGSEQKKRKAHPDGKSSGTPAAGV